MGVEIALVTEDSGGVHVLFGQNIEPLRQAVHHGHQKHPKEPEDVEDLLHNVTPSWVTAGSVRPFKGTNGAAAFMMVNEDLTWFSVKY